MEKDPAEVVRDLLERVDRGDETALDDLLGPDYVEHSPPPYRDLPPGRASAHEAFRQATEAFSDFRHTVDLQFADGDRVVTMITGRGTHSGEFMGIPATGRTVSMTGIAIHRVVEGKLVEHWAQVDLLSLLQQIGAIAT